MADRVGNRLRQWFEDAERQLRESFDLAARDRDYYDGKQWSDEEIAALQRRKQPIVVINRIKRKVDSLLGLERQFRTDPKAFPRNPNDDMAARAVTDALRFVVENNRYDAVRSQWFENLIIEGVAAVKVVVEPDDNEIRIKRIPADLFFYDPFSREIDFSDARFLGEVRWLDVDRAKEIWPERSKALDLAIIEDKDRFGEFEDRPNIWFDHKRKRVRVVQMRWRKGKDWRITSFVHDVILEDEKSPYVDEKGRSVSDIVAISAFIDRENNRYGAVREMISPQDEINKRRSKALHLLNVRQARIDPAKLRGDQNPQRVREELARPDGVIFAAPDAVELLNTSDIAQGQFLLLQEAKQEIDLTGPNPALVGRDKKTVSGRAVLAKQQAGLVEVAPLLDRKRDMDLRVYEQVWFRIRQFWTDERWIRITDDQDSPQFVGLNRRVTLRDLIAEAAQNDPEGTQALLARSPPDDLDREIIVNNVPEIDVDIILDEGPDTITLQAEQFEQLAQLAQSGAPIPPDVLIEVSSLSPRLKRSILDRLRATDPAQEAVKQLGVRKLAADVAEKEAKAVKLSADAEESLASAEERQSEAMLKSLQARLQL